MDARCFDMDNVHTVHTTHTLYACMGGYNSDLHVCTCNAGNFSVLIRSARKIHTKFFTVYNNLHVTRFRLFIQGI